MSKRLKIGFMSDYEFDEYSEDSDSFDAYMGEEAEDMSDEELDAVEEEINNVIEMNPQASETPSQAAPLKSLENAAGVAKDLSQLAQTATSGDLDKVLVGLETFSKAQLTRFLDITFIGPVLLLWAYKGKLSPLERALMAMIGLGTVAYNFRNFKKSSALMNNAQVQAIKDQIKEKMGV